MPLGEYSPASKVFFVGADTSALQHVFDAFVHNDYLLMLNSVENISCKRKQFSFYPDRNYYNANVYGFQ